jgi:response regulator RpfG family c-di-GMP phosphodiesterase/signal transduction histidine kinase
MYPLFIPLDFLIYPDLAATFALIRLAVVVLSIAVHFLMRISVVQRHAIYVAMFSYLYCMLSIVVMVHLADGYASPYYAGINLVLIAFMFILPLNLYQTATVNTIVYAAYVIPIFAGGGVDDVAVFTNNNFFLLSTMILVSVSSFVATNMRRREFASRYELGQANIELKKLDVLKSQFFASISHEIRTPLTSIMAPTESLVDGDVGELTTVQRELVAQVHRNAVRLLDLINQMLDFAKFDAKQMGLRLRRVDLARVVHNQVALFKEVCRRKGLELTSRVNDNIPVVFLDLEKVDRILSNLIRNAIKFTDQGSITVKLSRITNRQQQPVFSRSGESPDESWLVLQVEDTGIGIAPGDRARVFQRFQQVDGSSTRQYEGTGLGLAIVQEAVELQGGEIDVESVEGRGTTFTVFLPLDLDEQQPNAEIDRRQLDRRQEDQEWSGPERRVAPRRDEDFGRPSLGDIAAVESAIVGTVEESSVEIPLLKEKTGISVLYVEDNADLRTYISRMLRSLGHEIQVATDGVEGWNMAQREHPDIIVSDVMMPGIDGFELARRVKSNSETQKIPILLITAKSDTEARIEGLGLGADDYIAKPVNVRELDARIHNVVSDRKFRESLIRAEELERRIHELALGFSDALELRDGYTGGHSEDVLEIGTIIAEELDIEMTETIRESLLLHDIGKIGIPDSILRKPARLDPDEWLIMKRHSEMGADLLSSFSSLRHVGAVVRAHHERYDGSGYPDGLRGEEIPQAARLISVADAWHAMMEDRTYRKALAVGDAVTELVRHRGGQFDPRMVNALLEGLVKRNQLDADLVAAHLQNARQR